MLEMILDNEREELQRDGQACVEAMETRKTGGDLISRSELVKAIEKEYDLDYGEDLIDPYEFAEMVATAPTVDAVPVVRCRQCEYYKREGRRCWGRCLYWEYEMCGETVTVGENEFCSNGKRRNDNE